MKVVNIIVEKNILLQLTKLILLPTDEEEYFLF